MKMFGVEEKKSYRENTGLFKKYVLDVAIAGKSTNLPS